MNNLDIQNHLLDLIDQDYLIITETERFAHQLHWRYRVRRSESEKEAWESPRIVTLNRWMERCWETGWPENWPASDFMRWKLLGQVIEQLSPPEPLVGDIPLVLAVDESFGHCLRYGVDPGSGDPSNKLVEWRRKLWHQFRNELQSQGHFHPASLPEVLNERLCENPDRLPQKVVCVGFEFPGYHENRLLNELSRRRGGLHLRLPKSEPQSHGLSFNDPEQELYRILEDLTSAASNLPLHELAVVVLDQVLYCPLISRHFNELFGRPLLGDRSSYNLFPDRTLSRQPLFQAALLPTVFSMEEQSRMLLLGLLRSPYYGYLAARSRALCQWDSTWRGREVENGLRELIGTLSDSEKGALPRKGDELNQGLSPFLGRDSKPCAAWIEDLQGFWTGMEFPIIANESDRMSWQNLTDLLERLSAGFGSYPMKVGEFTGWVRAAADKIPIQQTGIEDAGIQVIGALETRGLAFKRLYIPGLVSGVLPQPVRPLPLLSAPERKLVQGGSAESQFEFASHLFLNLQAAADEVTMSRPIMNPSGETAPPSPFWPESNEQKHPAVIPWRHHMPALQRAKWVIDGIRGIDEYAEGLRSESRKDSDEHPKSYWMNNSDQEVGNIYQIDNLALPNEISVSNLATLIACPSRFFFQEILRIEPLPQLQRGLNPQKRGETVHKILASFGRTILGADANSALSYEYLSKKLFEVIEKVFSPYAHIPYWAVEKRRLLGGREDMPGLLIEWLRLEWERLQGGWRWVSLEAPFSHLELNGCSIFIKGRLDRLDYHPEDGYVCWDYKTGKVPGLKEIWDELLSPQLPVYLLAIRKGLIEGAGKNKEALSAGYIDLSSIRYLNHLCSIKSSEDTEAHLEKCEKQVAAAVSRLEAGDLTPRRLLMPCDFDCPYGCLCDLHC